MLNSDLTKKGTRVRKQLFLLFLISSASLHAMDPAQAIAIELEEGRRDRAPLLEKRDPHHRRTHPRCLAARLLAYTGLICSVGAQAAVYFYRDAIADPETVELFALGTGAPAIVAALIDGCANEDVPGSCF